MMKPRIKVLTLAVDGLRRSLAFYRDGLGLRTKGIIGQEFEDGAVVFFELAKEMILALYPAASLSKDAKVEATKARLGAVSIGYVVKSSHDVDALVGDARKAGAVVTDPPKDRSWGGYSGYFHDPNGHLWEVAWNPAWTLPDRSAARCIGLDDRFLSARSVFARVPTQSSRRSSFHHCPHH